MLKQFKVTFKRNGSVWVYIRRSFYRRSILHTSGPSYIHEHDNRSASCWSWDKNGNAIGVVWKARKEMAKLLRIARKEFTKIKSELA